MDDVDIASFSFENENNDRTYSVQQHIGRLEISVQHGSRMDILERTEDLIKKVLGMLVSEALPGVDDPMQVRFHELRDDVHILLERCCKTIG